MKEMKKNKVYRKTFVSALYFVVPFLIVLAVKYFNTDGKYQPLAKADTIKGSDIIKNSKLPDTVDFNFHIKPILSDRCFLCHGPDEGTREAGLRFDTEEGAFKALGEGLNRHAIVPGDIEKSQLVKRITALEDEKRMPPKTSNLSLSEYEKQLLIKWIEQGAIWKKHWSFVPPVKKALPKVSNPEWASNDIDYFILKRLDQEGVKPSGKASKEKLLRKVYFDLTGLPPSISDIDSFLSDTDANAYEKVVDRLLASKAYGERMASDWLDVARYADTHGYQDDVLRFMWPWRDWVINAYNKNLSYDKFVEWQIAGDLLPNATVEQVLATGFNRNHKITQEDGIVEEEYRVEYVLDRTNTTSKAILGLTMECAQCHDHKYDPISQKEYFSFFSFFNKVKEKGKIGYDELPEPNLKITKSDIEEVLAFINLPDSIEEVRPMTMKDDAPNRKTFVLKRGAYDAPADEVQASTPKVVLNYADSLPKNRLGLAKWFFDDKNALVSRVAVNRMWQQIFGVGIVSTSADFGNQGALPSHPDLLDYLAVTFREEGWNMKQMYKKMVMSSTYQQTSKVTPQLLEIDPNNILLARSSRSKLSAEMVRDNVLAVSGLLVNKVGGPSVKPYQPPGLWAETTSGVGLTTYIPDTGDNLYRRSLYTFWKRTVPPPSMITFDAPTRDLCEVKRQKTSTPLQALAMLNDPQFINAAKHLAENVVTKTAIHDSKKIELIFRKITTRYPSEDELKELMTYLESVKNEYESEKENSEQAKSIYAYRALTSLIFNLDEAIIKG